MKKIVMVLILIGLGLGGIIGAKIIFKNDDYPYTYLYISSENNEEQSAQVQFLDSTLKANGLQYDVLKFPLVQVGEKKDMVMKISDFNQVASYLKINTASMLGRQEAIIIPRYENSLKNTKYMNQLKDIKTYDLGSEQFNIVGVADNKILVTGLFKNQFVVCDETYQSLESDSNNTIYYVYAYTVTSDKNISSTSSELLSQLNASSRGNYFFFVESK